MARTTRQIKRTAHESIFQYESYSLTLIIDPGHPAGCENLCDMEVVSLTTDDPVESTLLHHLFERQVDLTPLRPAVIWRKLSFGTQSARGSRFVETILTVVETCHRQSRNSFEYLTAAIQAHLAGQPIPSLLTGV
jgi:non-ribosomal peptide synthetase component F